MWYVTPQMVGPCLITSLMNVTWCLYVSSLRVTHIAIYTQENLGKGVKPMYTLYMYTCIHVYMYVVCINGNH